MFWTLNFAVDKNGGPFCKLLLGNTALCFTHWSILTSFVWSRFCLEDLEALCNLTWNTGLFFKVWNKNLLPNSHQKYVMSLLLPKYEWTLNDSKYLFIQKTFLNLWASNFWVSFNAMWDTKISTFLKVWGTCLIPNFKNHGF